MQILNLALHLELYGISQQYFLVVGYCMQRLNVSNYVIVGGEVFPGGWSVVRTYKSSIIKPHG